MPESKFTDTSKPSPLPFSITGAIGVAAGVFMVINGFSVSASTSLAQIYQVLNVGGGIQLIVLEPGPYLGKYIFRANPRRTEGPEPFYDNGDGHDGAQDYGQHHPAPCSYYFYQAQPPFAGPVIQAR